VPEAKGRHGSSSRPSSAGTAMPLRCCDRTGGLRCVVSVAPGPSGFWSSAIGTSSAPVWRWCFAP